MSPLCCSASRRLPLVLGGGDASLVGRQLGQPRRSVLLLLYLPI